MVLAESVRDLVSNCLCFVFDSIVSRGLTAILQIIYSKLCQKELSVAFLLRSFLPVHLDMGVFLQIIPMALERGLPECCPIHVDQ